MKVVGFNYDIWEVLEEANLSPSIMALNSARGGSKVLCRWWTAAPSRKPSDSLSTTPIPVEVRQNLQAASTLSLTKPGEAVSNSFEDS